jgi:hypothetical protein
MAGFTASVSLLLRHWAAIERSGAGKEEEEKTQQLQHSVDDPARPLLAQVWLCAPIFPHHISWTHIHTPVYSQQQCAICSGFAV